MKSESVGIWLARICRRLLIILVTILIATGCSIKDDNPSAPNIVLILADDLGYSDIGCFGGDIKTPVLDKLAGSGTVFTSFLNSARCNPSRAALMTGLYPHRAGMGSTQGVRAGVPGYTGEINENCVTIAEVLGGVGYRNYVVGKWHLTHSHDGSDISDWPLQRGFDRFFGTIYGAGSYFDPRMLYSGNTFYINSPEGFYYTDAISDTAVTYIREHLEDAGESPFFLYVAYTAPHWPIQARGEDVNMYKGKFDKGWDIMREEKTERMLEAGLIDPEWSLDARNRDVPEWENIENKEWETARMEVYAAMVDCMDRGIGRIVDILKSEGIYDNTVIIFLSDNGACAEIWSGTEPWAKRYGPEVTRDGKIIDYSNDGSRLPGDPDTYHSYGMGWAAYSNLPFRGYKSSTWEGGIATPLIFSWPERFGTLPERNDQVAGVIDIMPTLISIAGAKYPDTYRGKQIIPQAGTDLLPIIAKEREQIPRIYFVEHIGNCSVTTSDGWKLIRPHGEEWQLYNLLSDRTETEDLINNYPELADSLAGEWERWAGENCVLPLDTVNMLVREMQERRN